MKHWQANLMLLFAGAVWGMGFVAQATAMDSIGPFLFIALRFLVASLVVLPFAIREAGVQITSGNQEDSVHTCSGRALLTVSHWLKFSLIGLCLFAGMATQQVGLLSTSVTNSGFLTGLYVVFTPILSVVLFRQLPHTVTWFAAGLSFLGVFFLSGGNLVHLTTGDYLTILSALFWGLQVVLIGRYVAQTDRPLALSLTQFVITGFLAFVVALIFEPIVWSAIREAWVEVLYAGMFASGLAFTLQVIGQRYTSAPKAAIMLSSEAPFAALFAYLWLGERLIPIGFLGCLFILMAMLLVELVPLWLGRRSTQTVRVDR